MDHFSQRVLTRWKIASVVQAFFEVSGKKILLTFTDRDFGKRTDEGSRIIMSTSSFVSREEMFVQDASNTQPLRPLLDELARRFADVSLRGRAIGHARPYKMLAP